MDSKHRAYRLHLNDLRNASLKDVDRTIERRAERYYQCPWPTSFDFGNAEFKDEQKRQYRLATRAVSERFEDQCPEDGNIFVIKIRRPQMFPELMDRVKLIEYGGATNRTWEVYDLIVRGRQSTAVVILKSI